MYVVYLGLGHTLLCKTAKSSTIKRYLTEAASRIQQRRKAHLLAHPRANLPWLSPIRTHGDNKLAPEITDCLKEIHRWENMKDRREPLTTDMIHFQQTQCLPFTPHSVENVMLDWEVIGIYAGLRLSEWAQEDHVRHRDQVKLTIDGSPTAFLINDLEFFQKGRRRLDRSAALRRPYLVEQVDVRWRYQKNGEKNEKKTFVRIGRSIRDRGTSTLCAVSAWLRVAQRWVDLKLDEMHPLAVFTDSGLPSGTIEFIRPAHINAALRTAARAVYNITAHKVLARFPPIRFVREHVLLFTRRESNNRT
jgi:hypothetical protein